eukprot:TRINITY_DN93426_c0_g1_i1.p1 TRINITY_DN93426_c0_g1~~TRINITY_DN93426_c0_g1_i1.p1  ORF type:complete len:228 (-),score=53.82 TRINITY_DN93426_c0_g1_i1:58-741(-)
MLAMMMQDPTKMTAHLIAAMAADFRLPPGLSLYEESPISIKLGQDEAHSQADGCLNWSENEVAFVTFQEEDAEATASMPREKENRENKQHQKACDFSCEVPPLVRAAGKGDFKKVLSLLNDGEDPNSVDDLGMSALHCAAKKGDVQIVSLLLDRGADANLRAAACTGEVPLHYACKYGHEQIVQMLLRWNADASIATQDGRTAMDYAKEKNRVACEEALIAHESSKR